MRCMRGQTTQDDVVSKTELQDLECFMASEAIVDQHTWLSVGSYSSLRITHAREPVQADLGVVVAVIRVRIMPSRSLVGSPITAMG
jgi:hypothetical protein